MVYRIFFILPSVLSIILLNLKTVHGDNRMEIPQAISPKIEGRIVNGTKAELGQFPFIISLCRVPSRAFFCGGSIINERWILTAAHCMFSQFNALISASSIMVVGGDLQLFPGSFRSQTKYVSRMIINPKFNLDYLQHDIALLMLKTPFNLNSYIRSVNWAPTMPEPGTECFVAGWGYLNENSHNPSNDLTYVSVPIISHQICQKLFAEVIYIGPGIFCAGYLDGGKDACQGDSGGPLTCNGKLTGIVSGGIGCARSQYPGFYTKVTHYINWIEQVVDSRGFNVTYEGVAYNLAYFSLTNGVSILQLSNIYLTAILFLV